MQFIGSWSNSSRVQNFAARYQQASRMVEAQSDIGYEELSTGSYTFVQPLTPYDHQRIREAQTRAEQAERDLIALNNQIAQRK